MDGALQPSLWIVPYFDALEFFGHYLSFLENFLGDYQSLHKKSPSYLTNLLEV